MIDILIGILCTLGAFAILAASVGIVRMPDFFLRMSVTVKAATLGSGLLLLGAAILFPQTAVATKAVAIILFLVMTAPVSAHMISRAAYLSGVELWKGTVRDDLEGMYDEETHVLSSGIEEEESDDRESRL
jgi:multicomponent Na+:H+ antiporter subunit G